MEFEKTFEGTLDALAEAAKAGMDPALERFIKFTEFLGRPQDKFKSLQVAGTNGKSSTVRMMQALLQAHGYHVGLFTSPHLVRYSERFEIDGAVVDDDTFVRFIWEAIEAGERFASQEDKVAIHTYSHGGARVATLSEDSFAGGFTEYEILTAACFLMFADAGVDYAVLEVGLGGRWDATTAVHPDVAVVTGIGLDHTAILGDTLEAIAGEKAAIIEPGSVAVIGVGCHPVEKVIVNRAKECGCKMYAIDNEDVKLSGIGEDDKCHYEVLDVSPHLILDVEGIFGNYRAIEVDKPFYQAANIACAITSIEAALQRALDVDKVRQAIATVLLPGRFETLSDDPLLIIDAAHNPQSAQVLATAIQNRFELNTASGKKPRLLLAVLADKDYRGIIDALYRLVDDIVVTQTTSPRAIKASNLALVVSEVTGKVPDFYSTVPEALERIMADGKPTVASGSITLAGEVKGWFQER